MDPRHENKLILALAVLAQKSGIGSRVPIPIDNGVEWGLITLDGVLDSILDGYRAANPGKTTVDPPTPVTPVVAPTWPNLDPNVLRAIAEQQQGIVRGPDGAVVAPTVNPTDVGPHGGTQGEVAPA